MVATWHEKAKEVQGCTRSVEEKKTVSLDWLMSKDRQARSSSNFHKRDYCWCVPDPRGQAAASKPDAKCNNRAKHRVIGTRANALTHHPTKIVQYAEN